MGKPRVGSQSAHYMTAATSIWESVGNLIGFKDVPC
jgi:hypothetical protein